MAERCVPIAVDEPTLTADDDGIVFLADPDHDSLRIRHGTAISPLDLPAGGWIQSIIMSPDRDSIAYLVRIRGEPPRVLLANREGGNYAQWTVDASTGSLVAWMDQSTITFTVSAGPSESGSLLWHINSLDIATGSVASLPDAFPGIDLEVEPAWGIPLSFSGSFPRVFYFAGEGGVVLWDTSANKVIAAIPYDRITRRLPEWSPNGSEAVFAGNDTESLPTSGNESHRGHQDLYAVAVDGNIRRLTSLSSGSLWSELGSFSWAPNSGKIAFWYATSPPASVLPQFTAGEALAVVDLQTHVSVGTCISGSTSPIWSPDGNHIAVNAVDPDGLSLVVAIDLRTWTGRIVTRDPVMAVAWLRPAEASVQP